MLSFSQKVDLRLWQEKHQEDVSRSEVKIAVSIDIFSDGTLFVSGRCYQFQVPIVSVCIFVSVFVLLKKYPP